jgi:Uma2 family endonuclease
MIIKTDPITDEIIYPSSDGKRMAENTLQYRYITTIHGGIDAMFAQDPNVFVAADLLWYPVQGQPQISTAPDTMVVIGRPKGERLSYLQWKEDNMPPQVVFEVLSPSNTPSEMNRKLAFYDRYGVKEYYIYDPDNGEFYGYIRSGERLTQILENMQGYQSPILKITFEIGEQGDLKIYDPSGMPFLSYREQTERFFQEHKMRIAEEKAKEEALKMLEEERKAKEEERKAKEEERKAKEEERKAKEEALAELERLRQLLKDK